MKTNLPFVGCVLFGATAFANNGEETATPSPAYEEAIGPKLFEPSPWTNLLASEDITMTFFGRLQLDATWVSGDSPPYDTDDGAEIRRGRMGVKGKILELFDYKFEVDFAGGDADFKDVYASTPTPIGKFKLGHFKEPQSLEELTSSRFITFIERALPNAFVPGRNLGIELTNFHEDLANLNWSIGLFRETNDFGEANTDDEPDEEKDGEYAVTARVSSAPVADEDTLVHAGVSFSYRGLDNGEIRYRSRPEAHLMNRPADSGAIPAENAYVLGFELAADQGPFSVQSEYLMSTIDPDTGSDIDYSGWYAQGSWNLTGEQRNFKTKGAKYDRPKVGTRVTRDDWKAGLVELAARYSMIDLDDGPSDNKLKDVTIGTNWWMNSHTRFSVNYIHSELDDSGADDDADILVARFQIDW